MVSSLDKIIVRGESMASSVNWNLLHENTESVYPSIENNEQVYPIQWEYLRSLHLLVHENFPYSFPLDPERGQDFGWYLDKAQTWLLIVGASEDRIAEYLSKCTNNLEKLTIRFTSLSSFEIGHLTGLKELNLDYNSNLKQIRHIENLRQLEILEVNHTSISDLNMVKCFSELKTLSANYTRVTSIPSMDSQKNLTRIFLEAAPITELAQVRFPLGLEYLNLSRTYIRKIPYSLRSLAKLYRLELRDLNLDCLPNWLPELGLEFHYYHAFSGILIGGTVIKGVDRQLFMQPQHIILQWFKELNKGYEQSPEEILQPCEAVGKSDEYPYDDTSEKAGSLLNELKVVFLGDGGAGKSYTIARLLADGAQPQNFDGNSTPGIVITDKQYRIGDRDVQIHFWDFGGQEILHSMHRMFLTERTLYVVLLNVRDGTQDERARYWLHNIKSFAPNAPVLVVLNQMDENPNASINENDLKSMAPGMTETVMMSALKYSADEFNAVFTSALLRQIGQMSETLDFFFPAAWTKVKQSLRTMEDHYIHGDRYNALCQECGVTDEGELRKGLLKWFNDLGVSFCYGDARLEDYVILRPDWLTNAIYIILFNKLENVRNGIVPLQTIYKVLNPDPADRNKIRRVLPDVTYTQDEVSYVLNVIRRFRLSFQVNETEEFIPMLCDRNSLDVAAEYENDRSTLEFRMEYDYLPNNVLHRLMVQLRGHLDTDNVWLTGARFEQQSTGLSAVVKSEGNDLRIFVRSTKKIYPANTYLSFIKDELDRINRDIGLTAPSNLVIYKADGIAEEFDYDDLINALEDGEDTYRSRIRRKRIPIMDILNQTGHTADQDRDKLLQDIVSACMSMQSQKLYWHLPDTEIRSKENVRNDNIREMLRAKGYIASDQSRSGRTQGGSQAGLLDIDIRRSADVPWTIFEALNISKADKKDTDYWDDHLKKLLDYYNPMGLPYLFLVSYLECSREDFLRISSAYNEHMRWHDPQSYERASSSFEILPQKHGQFISTAKCTYDRGGIPTTVYHICVRLGD